RARRRTARSPRRARWWWGPPPTRSRPNPGRSPALGRSRGQAPGRASATPARRAPRPAGCRAREGAARRTASRSRQGPPARGRPARGRRGGRAPAAPPPSGGVVVDAAVGVDEADAPPLVQVVELVDPRPRREGDAPVETRVRREDHVIRVAADDRVQG